MFVACGIWCLADVSSVSPSSEQTVPVNELFYFWQFQLTNYFVLQILSVNGEFLKAKFWLFLRPGETPFSRLFKLFQPLKAATTYIPLLTFPRHLAFLTQEPTFHRVSGFTSCILSATRPKKNNKKETS